MKALTLEGAFDGIKFLFTPDWERLKESQVWIGKFFVYRKTIKKGRVATKLRRFLSEDPSSSSSSVHFQMPKNFGSFKEFLN